MEHVVQDLKDAFGCASDKEFAQRMGVKPPTVTMWKNAGIGPMRWQKICKRAKQEGVPLPQSFLGLMIPQAGSKDAA